MDIQTSFGTGNDGDEEGKELIGSKNDYRPLSKQKRGGLEPIFHRMKYRY